MRTGSRRWDALRSVPPIGGHTWETVPTRVAPPPPLKYVHVDGVPLVQFPNGPQVVAATLGPSASDNFVGVYGTDDNGLTWEYMGAVTRDPTGLGRPTYANLLLLPSGRLQCLYPQHRRHP